MTTATTPAKRGRKPGYAMSEEHKKNLAEGREVSRKVKAYLEALQAQQPKRRGRRRTPESIEKRIGVINDELAFIDNPLDRLNLIAERDRLADELKNMTTTTDLPELEEAFVEAARDYGLRKGITYGAWRSIGVEPEVLKRAGIGRSRTAA